MFNRHILFLVLYVDMYVMLFAFLPFMQRKCTVLHTRINTVFTLELMKLTHDNISRIEEAIKSSNNQKLLNSIQNDIEKKEQELLSTMSDSYKQVIAFCSSFNCVCESLDNLIELNGQCNGYLQDNNQKLRVNLDELKNLNAIESNIDLIVHALQKINKFEAMIDTLKETDAAYELVSRIKELDDYLFSFKKFDFYSKFNVLLVEIKDKIVKKVKEDVIQWMNQTKSSLNFLGCEFIKIMAAKHSLVFDYRYQLKKNIQIQKIYDCLYIFSSIKDKREILDKINLARKNLANNLVNEHNIVEDNIYNVLGFLLVDFYLLDINISFDLKETYDALISSLLRSINGKNSDVYETKNHLLVIKNALVSLEYKYKDVDDELLKLIFSFFQEEKSNIKTFADIERYIGKCEMLIKNYESRDAKTLFYKTIDNVLMEHFCLDEDYLHLLDRVQGKYSEQKFSATSKKEQEHTLNYNKIREHHINLLEKAILEMNMEDFNNFILNETKNLNNLKLRSHEKKNIIDDIKKHCLELFERKNRPIDKKNMLRNNAKKALIMKMMEQNL